MTAMFIFEYKSPEISYYWLQCKLSGSDFGVIELRNWPSYCVCLSSCEKAQQAEVVKSRQNEGARNAAKGRSLTIELPEKVC